MTKLGSEKFMSPEISSSTLRLTLVVPRSETESYFLQRAVQAGIQAYRKGLNAKSTETLVLPNYLVPTFLLNVMSPEISSALTLTLVVPRSETESYFLQRAVQAGIQAYRKGLNAKSAVKNTDNAQHEVSNGDPRLVT